MEAAFVEIGLEKNGFLYVDEIVGPELEGQAPRSPHPGPDQPRPGDPRPGGQGPDEDEGRPPDDRDLAPRPLRRLRPAGRGHRRLAPARGRRAHPPARHPQEARPAQGRRDRPHGRRGRVRGGHRARHPLPGEDLEGDPGARQEVAGAVARLQRGRAAAPRRPRPLHRRLREGARRRRPDLQAHRRLPEEDIAAHGRARRRATATRSRCSRSTASRTRSARRSTAASTCPPAATSSSTTPRRSPSSTSTPAASSARARRARARGSRTRSRRTTSRP